MAIATTDLRAIDVMTNAAALMNDPNMTDYTTIVMVPYVNMAIDELNDELEQANVAISNHVSQLIVVHAGEDKILNPPIDIVEVQEVSERDRGSNDLFIFLPRKELPDDFMPTRSLQSWCYQNQTILFNMRGCTVSKEVRLNYISKSIRKIKDSEGIIGNSNTLSFLSFKTAAFLAMFVGENPTRAEVLNGEAIGALERIIGISNKGKQQIMTRHRPFRAAYKMRGY